MCDSVEIERGKRQQQQDAEGENTIMISENQARLLQVNLDGFAKQHAHYGASFGGIMHKLETLLHDFKSLQRDHETIRRDLEYYKNLSKQRADQGSGLQMSTSIDEMKDHGDFVLLLVDGDGYYFDEASLRQGSDGGLALAQTLQGVIQDQLGRIGKSTNIPIVVRVFLDLHKVSQILARKNIVGCHPRSIAPFAAGFNQLALFDIVDCGNDRKVCERKLQENFIFHAKHTSCQHVFFAGCQSQAYLPMLKPFAGRKDQLTLIRGDSYALEYDDLDIEVVILPGIFMETARPPPSTGQDMIDGYPRAVSTDGSTVHVGESGRELSDAGICKGSNSTKGAKAVYHTQQPDAIFRQGSSASSQHSLKQFQWPIPRPVTTQGQLFCTDWIKLGVCRNAKCPRLHEIPADPRGSGILERYGPQATSESITDLSSAPPVEPSSVTDLSEAPPIGLSSKDLGPAYRSSQVSSLHISTDIADLSDDVRAGLASPSSFSDVSPIDESDTPMWPDTYDGSLVAESLPTRSEEKQDLIPVNKDGCRLDYYDGQWDRNQIRTFQDIVKQEVGPCVKYHLSGRCNYPHTCHFSHELMEDHWVRVLRQKTHKMPCSIGTTCRKGDCHMGHICYNNGCKDGRQAPGCKLGEEMHKIDPIVCNWLVPTYPGEQMIHIDAVVSVEPITQISQTETAISLLEAECTEDIQVPALFPTPLFIHEPVPPQNAPASALSPTVAPTQQRQEDKVPSPFSKQNQTLIESTERLSSFSIPATTKTTARGHRQYQPTIPTVYNNTTYWVPAPTETSMYFDPNNLFSYLAQDEDPDGLSSYAQNWLTDPDHSTNESLIDTSLPPDAAQVFAVPASLRSLALNANAAPFAPGAAEGQN